MLAVGRDQSVRRFLGRSAQKRIDAGRQMGFAVLQPLQGRAEPEQALHGHPHQQPEQVPSGPVHHIPAPHADMGGNRQDQHRHDHGVHQGGRTQPQSTSQQLNQDVANADGEPVVQGLGEQNHHGTAEHGPDDPRPGRFARGLRRGQQAACCAVDHIEPVHRVDVRARCRVDARGHEAGKSHLQGIADLLGRRGTQAHG